MSGATGGFLRGGIAPAGGALKPLEVNLCVGGTGAGLSGLGGLGGAEGKQDATKDTLVELYNLKLYQ